MKLLLSCMALWVALLILPACSTIEAILHPSQYLTLNLASQLTTAEDSAEIYVALPYCDKSPAPPCKDRAIVKKMRTYDTAAYLAIKTADATKVQSDLDAAQSALTAYQQIVTVVTGK